MKIAQFSTNIPGRKINILPNPNINKENAFEYVLDALQNLKKPITSASFLKICELAAKDGNYDSINLEYKPDSENKIDSSDSEDKTDPENDKFNEEAFKCLTQLAKNESYLFPQNVTRGFSKCLVIGFIIEFHKQAFNNKGILDCRKFRKWLRKNTNIYGHQIPDEYIQGVSIDHYGYIKFGRKNYSKHYIWIKDRFLG